MRGGRIDRLCLSGGLGGSRGPLCCRRRLLLDRRLLRLGPGEGAGGSDLIDHVALNRDARLEQHTRDLIGIEPALARNFNDSSLRHQREILSAMRVSAPRQRRDHAGCKA